MTYIKKGDLVALSNGEYSDYTVQCLVSTNADISLEQVDAASLKATRTTSWGGEAFEPEKLLAVLLADGLVTEVPYLELHLGGYHEYTPDLFKGERRLI